MVTKVVQVTNIAPQATKDQMSTLFGYLGKIEDIRLYPTIRDVAVPVQSRICYVKYFDPICVGVAQHMTNTVFIDRALIVIPVSNGEIPDEAKALEIMAQGTMVPGLFSQEPKLPSHVVNQLEGAPPNQQIITIDPHLEAAGLPKYPPLPATYDGRRIEEIRRTLLISNIDNDVSSEQLMGFFSQAGEVKYVKFCSRENDDNRYALIEFTEQPSVLNALKLNGKDLNGKALTIVHSMQAISKPQAKSNEAAQREIEEAMTRVKEAQNFISAAIDPVIGMLAKDKKRRSRSGSRSRRSRSRSHRRRRSRSRRRSHSRRSRSRSPRRRGRGRSRTPSRSRSKRSRSHSRRRTRSPRRRRTRSRSRKRSTSRSRRSRSKSKSRTSSSSHRSKKGSRDDVKDKDRREHSVSKDRREHSVSKERREDSVSKEKRSREKDTKDPKGDADKKDDVPEKKHEDKEPAAESDAPKSEDEAMKDKDRKSREKKSRHRSVSRSRSRSKSKGHGPSKHRSRTPSPAGKSSRKRSRSRTPSRSSRRRRSPSRSPSFHKQRRSRSGSARHKSRSHSRF